MAEAGWAGGMGLVGGGDLLTVNSLATQGRCKESFYHAQRDGIEPTIDL